jgi:hypothetical protein
MRFDLFCYRYMMIMSSAYTTTQFCEPTLQSVYRPVGALGG